MIRPAHHSTGSFSIFEFRQIGGVDDRDFNDDYERIWRIALQQRMTLVCFREGSDEIVGLNVLVVNTKNDPFMTAIKSQVFARMDLDSFRGEIIIGQISFPEQKQSLQ